MPNKPIFACLYESSSRISRAKMNHKITPKLNTETKSTWSTPIYQHVSTPEFTWLQVRHNLNLQEAYISISTEYSMLHLSFNLSN